MPMIERYYYTVKHSINKDTVKTLKMKYNISVLDGVHNFKLLMIFFLSAVASELREKIVSSFCSFTVGIRVNEHLEI